MTKPSEIFRSDLLKGQNIIVTGGGSGIGLEIVRECHRLGARLAIGARKVERLEAARTRSPRMVGIFTRPR